MTAKTNIEIIKQRQLNLLRALTDKARWRHDIKLPLADVAPTLEIGPYAGGRFVDKANPQYEGGSELAYDFNTLKEETLIKIDYLSHDRDSYGGVIYKNPAVVVTSDGLAAIRELDNRPPPDHWKKAVVLVSQQTMVGPCGVDRCHHRLVPRHNRWPEGNPSMVRSDEVGRKQSPQSKLGSQMDHEPEPIRKPVSKDEAEITMGGCSPRSGVHSIQSRGRSMPRLFTRRNSLPPDRLCYDMPDKVRRRIIIAFRQMVGAYPNSLDLDSMLDEVGNLLASEYGGLRKSSATVRLHPAIDHFSVCDDTMALDFVEACFHVFHNPHQPGVEAINRIFEDESLGYYLTPYIETVSDKPGDLFGRPFGRTIEVQRPQIVRKDSELLHAEAVKPAFTLLADKRYKGANDEFLQAHKHYRDTDYKACLNECLKTFESVMKIICETKKWAYDPKATARPLIQKCLDNGLMPTFSEQQLTSLRTLLESGIPTIRNKQGGHGQGSQPQDVPPELARYALHITAATVLLLVESAKI